MRPSAQLLMPLLAGVLHAAGVAWPFRFLLDYGQPQWALHLLSMAFLAGALVGASSARQAAWRAWVFTTVYLGCTFGWLFTAMHTYGGMPAPLAALAEWMLAGLLAVYFALAGGLWWRLARRGAFSGALLFGFLWMMAEMARGTWLTGFGWGAGGYAHLDGPLAFYAPWVGVYGMTALAAGLGMVLAQMASALVGWPSGAEVQARVLVRAGLPVAGVRPQRADGWVWAALVVAPPRSSGMPRLANPRFSISRATWVISSRDGVINPLRPTTSAPISMALSRILSHETMTPRSVTS